MFRIDPIDKYGNVDVKFFSSDEYEYESEVLRKYLKLEGFDEMIKTFFIDFGNRKWEISPTKKQRKK
jgi:hypothetical protein